ncbi:MAG: putative 50S ribosomal subunit protein L11 [Candidatus Hodgkinia cicadicola]|nr:MAG: putative 50S ribosomal subunit protein L11 [Candidatus Hodgkinia cicadicola]
MLGKKKVGFIKLCLRAGSAKPAPPVSSALGQRRLNVIEFCKRFNELTRSNEELEPLRVKVYVYSDRSYDLIVNAPTLTCLVRQMLSLDRCASKPGRLQVGALTRANIALLAAKKGNDMSAASVSAGIKCVVGSLRSMGISVER